MPTKQELEAAIKEAKANLKRAKDAFYEWESLAENNVYDDLDFAESDVEERLAKQAFRDCQGAHNCGQDTYTQDFMVDGKRYRGTLTCEYNRHDKMYYYIDGSSFSVVVLEEKD